MATGEGTAAWMFPVAEGAPSRVGELWAGHAVTVYDPPRHLQVRAEGPDGQVMNALEYLIEAKDGGTVLLRYVRRGVFTDDWDNQYDAAGQHTDFYLHTLGQYLRYFAGQRPTYIAAEGPAAAKSHDAFDALRRELGLTAASAPGDPVHITPARGSTRWTRWWITHSRTSSACAAPTACTGSSAGTRWALRSASATTCSPPTWTRTRPSWPGSLGWMVSTSNRFDLLLRGGWVVDGTGGPPFRADLAVTGDRVAAVGQLAGADATAAAELDATGRYLMPGFIDAHIHADGLADSRDAQLAALRQGVTTVLIGQDGLSFAPASKATIEAVSQYFGAVNGPCPAALAGGCSVADVLAHYDGKTALNVACLAPAGTIRAEVLGFSGARPAARNARRCKPRSSRRWPTARPGCPAVWTTSPAGSPTPPSWPRCAPRWRRPARCT